MEQEFYRGLAQRVRGMAEKADPFTRRRLLDLQRQYRVNFEVVRRMTGLAGVAVVGPDWVDACWA